VERAPAGRDADDGRARYRLHQHVHRRDDGQPTYEEHAHIMTGRSEGVSHGDVPSRSRLTPGRGTIAPAGENEC
jgi:hypothetical protein